MIVYCNPTHISLALRVLLRMVTCALWAKEVKMGYRIMCGLLVMMMISVTGVEAMPRHRLGVGVHYWRAIKDIDVDDVDESGFAPIVSYQYRPMMLLRFGAEVEMLPKRFGGADTQVYAPAAYAIIGPRLIYAGIGVGSYYADGTLSSDPFFNLRAGVEIPVFIRTRIDINANYRFNDWDSIKQVNERINTYTVTLGVALRLDI